MTQNTKLASITKYFTWLLAQHRELHVQAKETKAYRIANTKEI